MEDENGCVCPAEEKKLTADGQWDISCWAHCPHCEAYIDIMREKDSGLDWEAVPRPHDDTDDMDLDVTCGECKKEFQISKITY